MSLNLATKELNIKLFHTAQNRGIMVIGFILLALLMQDVTSHRAFQQRIPNGARVPFPCKPGEIWDGVGHLLEGGSGTRNPFGLDFAANNFNWTNTLCRTDSDGDGLTNGEELGDPDCVWAVNAIPSRTDRLSHPGICDPWDSPACFQRPITSPLYRNQGEWLMDRCTRGNFQCPALNESDVKNLNIRIPTGTPIPSRETTYICQIFNLFDLGLPNDTDYHSIAVTPIIENKDIVHHIVLTGCTPDTATTPEPYVCGMIASPTCWNFMHIWVVGMGGECLHNETGFRIGLNSHHIIALQIHWNNRERREGAVDSSGIKIYYTPHLRPYDAGVLITGRTHFKLPPREPQLWVNSTCKSLCTKEMIQGPVYITTAWNHMHYAGNKMNIELIRNGQSERFITNDVIYQYDSPTIHMFPTPFQMFPGDELIIRCGYTTANRNSTTFYGDETIDEMCFGIITYYPKQSIADPGCLNLMRKSVCTLSQLDTCAYFQEFARYIYNTKAFYEISQHCSIGCHCRPECVDAVIKMLHVEPCLRPDGWPLVQNLLKLYPNGVDFLKRLASCKNKLAPLLDL